MGSHHPALAQRTQRDRKLNNGGNQEEDAGYEGGEGQRNGQLRCL